MREPSWHRRLRAKRSQAKNIILSAMFGLKGHHGYTFPNSLKGLLPFSNWGSKGSKNSSQMAGKSQSSPTGVPSPAEDPRLNPMAHARNMGFLPAHPPQQGSGAQSPHSSVESIRSHSSGSEKLLLPQLQQFQPPQGQELSGGTGIFMLTAHLVSSDVRYSSSCSSFSRSSG